MNKETGEIEEVLPASAGMIRHSTGNCTDLGCAPRIRGDDPEGLVDVTDPRRCSPHPRG